MIVGVMTAQIYMQGINSLKAKRSIVKSVIGRLTSRYNVSISEVDQGLALALREQGVVTVDDFLSQYDETRLSEFRRPWGKQSRRVGKQAASRLLL